MLFKKNIAVAARTFGKGFLLMSETYWFPMCFIDSVLNVTEDKGNISKIACG